MKIIVHGGMKKTGSTTIQHTFWQLPQEVYTYMPTWGAVGPGWTTSHNHVFLLCFAELGERMHLNPLFEASGKTRGQLQADSAQHLA